MLNNGVNYPTLNKIVCPSTSTHTYIQIGNDCFMLVGKLDKDLLTLAVNEAMAQMNEQIGER